MGNCSSDRPGSVSLKAKGRVRPQSVTVGGSVSGSPPPPPFPPRSRPVPRPGTTSTTTANVTAPPPVRGTEEPVVEGKEENENENEMNKSAQVLLREIAERMRRRQEEEDQREQDNDDDDEEEEEEEEEEEDEEEGGLGEFVSSAESTGDTSLEEGSDADMLDGSVEFQNTKLKPLSATHDEHTEFPLNSQPSKPPKNLPKTFRTWLPYPTYPSVPPGSKFTVRNGVFWVGIPNDDDESFTENLASSFRKRSHMSVKLRSVRSFAESFKNITHETLLTEIKDLPMVRAGEGWVYYYVRENLPVDTPEQKISKTGYGLWLRCTEDEADPCEKWFPGRTVPAAELLKITKLPKEVPQITDMVWVPYETGVVGVPFHRDETVTAGVARLDGIVWQSYHKDCVPDGEVTFSCSKPDRLPVTKQEAKRPAPLRTTSVSGLQIKSGRSPVSPCSPWDRPSALPPPPSCLPKAPNPGFFWYPFLILHQVPEGMEYIVVDKNGVSVYWVLMNGTAAKNIAFGKSFPAEYRSFAEMDQVTTIPSDLPALPGASYGWVYYRSQADIPMSRKFDTSTATFADRSYERSGFWVAEKRGEADPSERLFFKQAKTSPPQSPGSSMKKSVSLTRLMSKEGSIRKGVSLTGLMGSSGKKQIPSAAPAKPITAIAPPNDVHKISDNCVWVPYWPDEKITGRYMTFQMLGGHIFKRDGLHWVVYGAANVPEGRLAYVGRTKAYQEVKKIKNIDFLPNYPPEKLPKGSVWVPFPSQQHVPPETTVLANFEHEGTAWRLIGHPFGEGYYPQSTSFAERMGVSMLPVGLPPTTETGYWVPYPSVEQISKGMEQNIRVVLSGAVYVFCKFVPSPEKGFRCVTLPELPRVIQHRWCFSSEIEVLARKNIDNEVLMKAVSKGKAQSIGNPQMMRAMRAILSVGENPERKAKLLSIMETKSTNISQRTQWVEALIAESKGDQGVREAKGMEILDSFLKANAHLRNQSFLCVKNEFINLQRLIYEKSGKEMVSRQGFTSSLRDALNTQDMQERRLQLLYHLQHAVLITYGFRPNESQLLAVICMTTKTPFGKGGGIGEMRTGEGKTVTIVMAAGYYTLLNKKVDVMTSSEILARRDAAKAHDYFDLLGKTVSHNCKNEHQTPSEVYKADVVYGTVAEFQFTYIREVYLNHYERGDRGYQVTIIDEVDNMLIDSSGRSARLSSSIPGMDQVHFIYYLIQRKIQEWGEVDADNISRVTDHCRSHPVVDAIFPENLKELVSGTMETWVKSAVRSAKIHQKEGYIISDDSSIINVDSLDTGVLQHGTVLTHGVHQFLQVKEGVPVTDESMTGGFSSVLAFFALYEWKTGLTGTIGEQEEQREFETCYDLLFFHVPTHHVSKRKDVVSVAHPDMLNERIREKVIRAAKKGRPVLLISETIRESEKLFQFLSDTPGGMLPGTASLQSYTGVQTKKEEDILVEAGRPGVVTCSTNLAGRGMDIVTNPETEDNGGLVVICTFLPKNLRVQLQAAGRTGRQGKKGDYELLIPSTMTVDKLMEKRRLRNTAIARTKLGVMIPIAQQTARMFKKFCALKDKHFKEPDNRRRLLLEGKYEKRALRENWMLFMQRYHKTSDQTVTDTETADAFIAEQDRKFSDFLKQSSVKLQGNTMVGTTLQYIRRAADFIADDRLVLARSDLNKALSLQDSEHPTLYLLHAYVASKQSMGNSRAKEVVSLMERASELTQKWIQSITIAKKHFPASTRSVVLLEALNAYNDSISHTLSELHAWVITPEGVPLNSLLSFAGNKSRVHTSESVPEVNKHNVVRLKRLGIVGTVGSAFHSVKSNLLRKHAFEGLGVRLIEPVVKNENS